MRRISVAALAALAIFTLPTAQANASLCLPLMCAVPHETTQERKHKEAEKREAEIRAAEKLEAENAKLKTRS
jgi:hypothetical protein